MELASFPSDFQAWFKAWIIENYKDDSNRVIEFFVTMEMMPMRLCLVTVGATASFKRLIREALSAPFLAQLARYRYTHLLVQYGKDGEDVWDEFKENFPQGCEQLKGVIVGGFDFRQDLWQYMRLAVKEKNQALGIIISHAGMIQLTIYLNPSI